MSSSFGGETQLLGRALSTFRLRKVTKKGCFENESALQKIFYLRIRELKDSWDLKPVVGWVAVRNQLAMYEPLCKRIRAHLPQWC